MPLSARSAALALSFLELVNLATSFADQEILEKNSAICERLSKLPEASMPILPSSITALAVLITNLVIEVAVSFLKTFNSTPSIFPLRNALTLLKAFVIFKIVKPTLSSVNKLAMPCLEILSIIALFSLIKPSAMSLLVLLTRGETLNQPALNIPDAILVHALLRSITSPTKVSSTIFISDISSEFSLIWFALTLDNAFLDIVFAQFPDFSIAFDVSLVTSPINKDIRLLA